VSRGYRGRMLRAALLFLSAAAVVGALSHPWDLVVALALLAVALLWAGAGLYRAMPPERRSR
jgi:hypothetical protein